jgi:hypothetical protein
MLKQAQEEMENHNNKEIEEVTLKKLYDKYLAPFDKSEAKILLESLDENHHDRKAVAWFVTHWLNKDNQYMGDKMYYELIHELKEHPVLGKNGDYYHDRAKYAEQALKENLGSNYEKVEGLDAFGHSLYDLMLREEEKQQPNEYYPVEHGRRVRGPALAESHARQRFEKWAAQLGKNFNQMHDFKRKKFEWMEPLVYQIYLASNPGVNPSDVIDNFHRLNSNEGSPHHEKTKIKNTVNAVVDNVLQKHSMGNIPYLSIVSKAVLHGMYEQISKLYPRIHVKIKDEKKISNSVIEKRREAEWMKKAKDAFERNYINKLTKDMRVKNTLNEIYRYNKNENDVVRYLNGVISTEKPNFIHRMVKKHAEKYRIKPKA